MSYVKISAGCECRAGVGRGYSDDTMVERAERRRGQERSRVEVDAGVPPVGCGEFPRQSCRRCGGLRHCTGPQHDGGPSPSTARKGTALGWPGFSRFVFVPSSAERSSRGKWPGVCATMDGGADGVAAVSALRYSYGLNLWVWPRP